MFGITVDNPELYRWVILPLLIFLARIVDQTLGTLRIIMLSRSMKYLAPIIGFFEVTIWLLAISQIIAHLDNVVCFLAYGGGFAAGNYIGILVEEKLAMGIKLVRVITNKEATLLASYLRDEKYGATIIDAEGNEGPVRVIYIVVKRKHLSKILNCIIRFNPNAFYTIEDVTSVSKGIFPPSKNGHSLSNLRKKSLKTRKGK